MAGSSQVITEPLTGCTSVGDSETIAIITAPGGELARARRSLVSPTTGPNPFAPIPHGKLVRVSEHCFIFRNTVNSGVVVGDDGVAVIDTQISEPMARRLVAAIRRVSDRPIRFAINTHYHWDHWAGNDVVAAAGAVLVGSSLTREFMQRRHRRQRAFLTGRGFSMPPHDPAHPVLTFDGELDLDLGGVSLELRHLGRAETDDATAVLVPADAVVVSGDTLMTGSFPILGQPVMAEGMSADRAWIRTLRALDALGAKAVIPGHGDVGGHAEIELFIELQEYFLSTVEALVEQGLTNEEILARMEAEMPPRYASMPQTWGTPRYAILRALRTCRGWQHEKPSALPGTPPQDLEAALADLVPAASSHADAAAAAARQGRTDLALVLLAEGTRAFPGDLSLWTARGRQLIEASRQVSSVLEKGDFFSLARTCLERALELDPLHGPALVALGGYVAMSCHRGGDDPGPALALLDRALAVATLDERGRAEAHFYRGIAFRAREDEESAGAEFRLSIAADPSFPLARMAMAPAVAPAGPAAASVAGAHPPRPAARSSAPRSDRGLPAGLTGAAAGDRPDPLE
jgi:glyoxylase-like metal-dependent hydrolase (beta-lactamase superfamily II)